MKNSALRFYFFIFTLLIFLQQNTIAQKKDRAIKIIPELGMKLGSQVPHLGLQIDLSAGILFSEKYFAGIGGAYCTNMGMGGRTFPFYATGKMYFSTQKSILFRSKDSKNDFALGIQTGIDINKNYPYKSGFLASAELSYRFDFLKIKGKTFPAFYAGLNAEYNYTRFVDEYRGYKISDGYIKHLMLNVKLAFEIPSLKL